ncbi:MAG: hypothetical protein ACTSRG_10815 [Candidatus Helarchaeota archaeon]
MWIKVKDNLGDKFSLDQFMEILGLDKKQPKEKREARNILKQLYQAKKIYRLSDNMYKKRTVE